MARRGKEKKEVDRQFEAFLKESLSTTDESLDSSRLNAMLKREKKGGGVDVGGGVGVGKDAPWWLQEKAKDPEPWWLSGKQDEHDGVGLSGTGKSFLKKKPSEVKVDQSKESDLQLRLPTESYETISKDSLETHNLRAAARAEVEKMGIPNLSLDSSTTYTEPQKNDSVVGMDTLDELKDKESFFKRLEDEATSLDYHRLNRDLDQSDTLPQDTTGQNNNARAQVRVVEGSVVQDMKNDAAGKPSMLDNVALLDSLDQTLGTTDFAARDEGDGPHPHSNDVAREDERRIATGAMGTGLMTTVDTSEMDALHQAYQLAAHSSMGLATNQMKYAGPVGSLRSAGSMGNEASEMSNERDTAPGSFGLKNIAPSSTAGGQGRTVDDILREVAEIEGKVQLIQGHGDLDTADEEEKDDKNTKLELAKEADGRGFDLSPIHAPSAAPNLMDYDHDDLDTVRTVEHSPDVKSRPQPAVRTSRTPRSQKDTAKTALKPPSKSPAKSPSAQKIAMKKKTSNENLARRDTSKSPSQNRVTQKSSEEARKTTKRTTSPVKRSPSPAKKRASPSPSDRFHSNAPPRGGYHGNARSHGNEDDQLRASVESFARYIKSTFTDGAADRKTMPEVRYSADAPSLSTSLRVDKVSSIERENTLLDEVKEWQDRWKEERTMHAKAKAELTALEKELKRRIELDRLEHQEEMFKLKQENFVLAAKVADQEERGKTLITSSHDANMDDLTRAQLAKLEKEVEEQEKLIVGYQQENEKLYNDLKKRTLVTKGTEEKMFNENQRLNTEVMNLRSQLEQKELELKNKGVITAPSVQRDLAAGTGTAIMGAGRIAQLEADLKQSKKREFGLEQQVKLVEQGKREAELYVERLNRDRAGAENRVTDVRTEGDHRIKVLKHEHELEVERLNKKLRWYAENQELLDRDQARLRGKEEEITMLKERIEEIASEAGKKRLETKARLKERAQDAKRIQDLERQVRELETILKKRNPNSLSALMYAAAQSEVEVRTPTVEYLENQVRRLEQQLEERDEEEKRDIRVLQQKFNAMKIQYEERVEELEKQLCTRADLPNHPHTHSGALQKELESVRERNRKVVAEKETEIDRLQKEVQTLKSRQSAEERKELTKAREAESELELRIRALQQELVNKDSRAKSLEEEVRKLKTEKDLMVIDSALHQDRHMIKEAVKGTKKKPAKEYEPDQFKGVHITEVMKENEELKLQSERHQLELNQQRVDLSKALAEREAALRELQDDMEDQISSLKKSHQSELERLITSHAMQHSDSKVAELQAKLETQELMVSHLKEQYADAKHKAEEVSVLRIREAALQAQVQQLLLDLRDAKRNHTPEMHHFDELMNKVRQLESRQSHRDSDLEQIIDRNKRIATANLEKENAKWRKIVENKNEEVRRFREELDSMLEVLKELRRQGVVMPGYKLKT